MKKVLFLFIGLLFAGCGSSDDSCCGNGDAPVVKKLETASAPNTPPVASFTMKIATPEEVQTAKENGTLVVVGEKKELHGFYAKYVLVGYSKCEKREFEAGSLIVSADAGSDSVDISYVLNDEASSFKGQVYFRVVNSGQLWLDGLLTRDQIDRHLDEWVHRLVNTPS